jgi:hypothetical protein
LAAIRAIWVVASLTLLGETFSNTGPIRKIARLGGLLNHYYRDPAHENPDELPKAA